MAYSLYRGCRYIEDRYIRVPLYEVFHKGKVDLNSVKFETRSIDQIECHSKHTNVADSLFTNIILFNTVQNEAKKGKLQQPYNS